MADTMHSSRATALEGDGNGPAYTRDNGHKITGIPDSLCGITSCNFGKTHVESAKIFLESGVKWIQYREKSAPIRNMIHDALEIKALCEQYGAKLTIDDRLDVALAVNADGLHLGQEDMRIDMARAHFHGMIGVSAYSLQEAVKAQEEGADYIGLISFYPSRTKADAKYITRDAFAEIRANIRIPIVAIGGITIENMDELVRLGADGIAVIGGVLRMPDPHMAAKSMLGKLNGARRQ